MSQKLNSRKKRGMICFRTQISRKHLERKANRIIASPGNTGISPTTHGFTASIERNCTEIEGRLHITGGISSAEISNKNREDDEITNM